MDIWTIVAAVGLPSAIIGGIVGLFFRRMEKKMDQELEARKQHEDARKEYESFHVKMLTATAKLGEANAIALQNGKCNGETHKALEYLKEVKHEQRDFLVRQGIDNLF